MEKTTSGRKRREMKPQTFETAKTVRRYLARFKWRYFAEGKYNPEIVKTVMRAFKVLKA